MSTQKKYPGFFRLVLALGLAMSLTAFYGCGKKGGGESAGEKVDDAVHEAGNGPKDLFDKDGKAENAGEKVDKALDGDK